MSTGSPPALHSQHDLRGLGQQGLRHVVPEHFPAVDREPRAARLLPIGILDPDMQLLPRKSFQISSAFHSLGMEGAILMPPKSGRIPRMPSTQPTITVEAVPVSQWTWDRPAWGLAFPSVNWP